MHSLVLGGGGVFYFFGGYEKNILSFKGRHHLHLFSILTGKASIRSKVERAYSDASIFECGCRGIGTGEEVDGAL